LKTLPALVAPRQASVACPSALVARVGSSCASSNLPADPSAQNETACPGRSDQGTRSRAAARFGGRADSGESPGFASPPRGGFALVGRFALSMASSRTGAQALAMAQPPVTLLSHVKKKCAPPRSARAHGRAQLLDSAAGLTPRSPLALRPRLATGLPLSVDRLDYSVGRRLATPGGGCPATPSRPGPRRTP